MAKKKKVPAIKRNFNEQYYKGVRLKLLGLTEYEFEKYKAKRYIIGADNSGQNIWIPNCYLQEDGTLKENINIDFVMKKAIYQKKFEYAEINIKF